jgi:hypothetical protein
LEEKKIGEDMGMNSTIKLPTLNPDGTSVKGCIYIYAPRGQAGEYAPLATNPYRGCGEAMAGGEGSELLRRIKYEPLREYRTKNCRDDRRP